MDPSTLWRAMLLQALAVGALFALLVALPLPSGFFREYRALVGPLAWLVCALVVARVLHMRASRALAAAVASGLVALAAATLLGHTVGMVAGVLAFGGVAALVATRPAAPA